MAAATITTDAGWAVVDALRAEVADLLDELSPPSSGADRPSATPGRSATSGHTSRSRRWHRGGWSRRRPCAAASASTR